MQRAATPGHGGRLMAEGSQPIYILAEGTERFSGRDAQGENIRVARRIADVVRSTLGPRGMDKMLVDGSGDVLITNDGSTVLSSLDISHPAAKMVVEIALAQDEECGDGTTSAVVLAGELLHRAEELLPDVHPSLINRGFQLAEGHAQEALDQIQLHIKHDDDETLQDVARTALAGKSAEATSDAVVNIVVGAVQAVAQERDGRWLADPEDIQLVKQSGQAVERSELVHGIVTAKQRLQSSMPKRVDEARIAVIDVDLDARKTQADAEIEITDPSQLQTFLDAETQGIQERIDVLVQAGATVLFSQQAIPDKASQMLARQGILAFESLDEDTGRALSRATGASVLTDLSEVSADELGQAGVVEQRTLGGQQYTFVTGCAHPEAVTLLLRGGTDQVVDELERAVNDGLRVVALGLEDTTVVPGGGAPEIHAAHHLAHLAPKIGGREALAVEAFAQALEVIPRTLAENAGLDAVDVLAELRTAHDQGHHSHGLDVYAGEIGDMVGARILEPLRVKVQALKSASEAARMLLRIDDVIASKGALHRDEDA